MLRYTEFCLIRAEVPGETSICIYISGYPNRCPECHYPLLQSTTEGELLSEYFDMILELYGSMATCVCFLGEGDLSEESRIEMTSYASRAHGHGLKCCLYSGRDITVEKWMNVFDYIKTGSYKKEFGALDCCTTNQRLYQKKDSEYIDITSWFWSRKQ